MKWGKMCAKLNVLTLLALSNVYKKWMKKLLSRCYGGRINKLLNRNE
nr:MAG TPA: hypothetical protein [Caudoviricetes sp.]